jgi:hypothetical protein
MESPFTNIIKNTVILFVEPILNPSTNLYQTVITLSAMPAGPLSNMVKELSLPKLSPFYDFTNPSQCAYVLLRYPKANSSLKNDDAFMNSDDIPSVFSYLRSNGYTIDSDLTRILMKSHIFTGESNSRLSGSRKMICMIHYDIVE